MAQVKITSHKLRSDVLLIKLILPKKLSPPTKVWENSRRVMQQFNVNIQLS